MALAHAQPCQPIDVAPLGARLPDMSTHAILKTHAIELIRMVMRAGDFVPPHQVRGEITLLCIEGTVEVSMEGQSCRLQSSQLVLMAAGTRHAVRALEDASLLLTIQLPAGEPGSASSTH